MREIALAAFYVISSLVIVCALIFAGEIDEF